MLDGHHLRDPRGVPPEAHFPRYRASDDESEARVGELGQRFITIIVRSAKRYADLALLAFSAGPVSRVRPLPE